MKILARVDSSKLIIEVKQSELESLFDKGYDKRFKDHELLVGAELDLNEAYDYLRDVKDLFRNHADFIKSNVRLVDAMNKGIHLMIGESE